MYAKHAYPGEGVWPRRTTGDDNTSIGYLTTQVRL